MTFSNKGITSGFNLKSLSFIKKSHFISSLGRTYSFCSRKWNVLNKDLSITSRRYFSSKNHYETLNLPKGASQNQIRAAYFRLSKKYHPDVNKDPDATLKFNQISEAYMVLSNAGQRLEYDNRAPTATAKKPTVDDFAAHQEFIYKEFTSFKRRSNTGGYQTGRTPHFNFDEHYRMHYENLVKEQHAEKRKRENFEEMRRRHLNHEEGVRSLCYIMVFCFCSFIIYCSKYH